MLQKVIFENYHKSQVWKSEKKVWWKPSKYQKQCEIQITIFLESLYFSLSVCINIFFGGNSRTWNIWSQSWDTFAWAGPAPVLSPNCPINMKHALKKDVLRCKSHVFDVLKLIHIYFLRTNTPKIRVFGVIAPSMPYIWFM